MTLLVQDMLAPAKVNLRLRIVGRRIDGYHLVDSIMVPVSLFDELHVEVAPRRGSIRSQPPITVTSDSETAPGGRSNLAYRAAAIYLAAAGRSLGVHINLVKRIPVGSGLGGGSSDAAAVLLVLNRILGSPLSTDSLCRLAAQLGADVPFFVHGRPARIRGIGEQVTPLQGDWSVPLVLCSDGQPLSTALVYSRVRLSSLTSEQPASSIPRFVDGRTLISQVLANDLEKAAAEIHPGVLSLKAMLTDQGALAALMTGSGSAVFGVWPDLRNARSAARRLRELGLWAEAVETLNASPAVQN